MRVIHPYVGDNVADVCRRAYFELDKSDEPIILHFNEVTILFTKDMGGYHHPDNNIDAVKLEWHYGMNIKELYDSSTQTKNQEKEE